MEPKPGFDEAMENMRETISLFFKPEDFDEKVLDLDVDGDRKFILCYRDAECIAIIANKILKERLKKCESVTSHKCLAEGENWDGAIWDAWSMKDKLHYWPSDTHEAYLVHIRKLEKP